MIIWKSANCVVSFNCNSTVYTKSVSPEFVALKSAFLFSPNFNRSGTCRLDFGSNSRSWHGKKEGKNYACDLFLSRLIWVSLLLLLNFYGPIPVLFSQYCKMKYLGRQRHAVCQKFFAPHRHHLKVKEGNEIILKLTQEYRRSLTFVMSDFMECPMLENPWLGQLQVFCNLNSQTVVLPKYQSIEYYVRFQMVESAK